VVVTTDDADYMGKIRFAVEEGLPVLFEDVGTHVPRHLNHILSRQTYIKRKKTYVQVCMPGDLNKALHHSISRHDVNMQPRAHATTSAGTAQKM
jgi:hypothetical protein